MALETLYISKALKRPCIHLDPDKILIFELKIEKEYFFLPSGASILYWLKAYWLLPLRAEAEEDDEFLILTEIVKATLRNI